MIAISKFLNLPTEVSTHFGKPKLDYVKLAHFLKLAQEINETPIKMHRNEKNGVSLWSSSSELFGQGPGKVPKVLVRVAGKTLGWLKVLKGEKLRLVLEKKTVHQKKLFELGLTPDKVEIGYNPWILTERVKNLSKTLGIQKKEMEIHAALFDLFAEDENKHGSKAARITPTSPYSSVEGGKAWRRVIFQLPLPISASDGRVRGETGYTDLLVRFQGGGSSLPIGVLEVKRDSVGAAAAEHAFYQAIAYALALRMELELRPKLYLGLLGLEGRHRISRIYAMPAMHEKMEQKLKSFMAQLERAASARSEVGDQNADSARLCPVPRCARRWF